MIRILAISLLFIIANVSHAQTATPKFKFEKKVQKLPKTKAGDILDITYAFTNTGEAPLIISDIKVACSCTTPRWPSYPVLPGKTDTIHVNIATKTMIGWQDRMLKIYSNTEEPIDIIRFKIMVDNSEEKKK